MSALHLIFARSRNGVIGLNGAMPWHLPEDLAHFRRTTQGHPVIMGRKTWDSLPQRFRPLPARSNIVITRQQDWRADGAQVVHSLEDAMAHSHHAPIVWVMGGAEIYRQALPLAQRVVVTEIDADFQGDAYAPELGPQWCEIARESHVSDTGLPFAWVSYERIPA